MDLLSLNWKGKFFYVDLFPLMSSPYPILLIIIAYLIFVLKIGPIFMKNRQPYNLSEVLRLYNVFQVIACTYIVTRAHFIHGYSFFTFSRCIKSGIGVDESDLTTSPPTSEMITFHIDFYLFMILRLFELIETVFFVLRKKFNQVSLLHMYHHISTITITWMFLKYRGGRMEMFIAVINSYVHIIMYFYYFLSSFKRYQPITNKIKPFITTIQIIQLTLILIQCIAIALCEESDINYVLVGNFVVNLVLFTHFFLVSYIFRKKKMNFELNNNRNEAKNEKMELGGV